MDRPLIGITTKRQGPEDCYIVSAQYAAAVRRAGGYPLLIPPDEPEIERLIKRLDGVILSGGGDIASELYGGAADSEIYSVDSIRDHTEIQIVQYATSHAYPLLGICRGIQIMNVALGGTLIEHLPRVVGETIPHRLPGYDVSVHTVSLEKGSRLAHIFGAETFDVPSSHHQALRKPASPFVITAHAPDGIIEAVEIANHPFFIGVQWHPERSEDPLQHKLFAAFIQAALRSAA